MADNIIAQAYVQIIPTTDGIGSSISKAIDDSGGEVEKASSSLGSKIGGGLSKGLTGAGTVLGTSLVGAIGLTKGLTDLATSSASTADHIDKMSQKIGISREAYQELDFIASQSGMSVDSLQSGMKSLTAVMDGVANGTESSIQKFEALGVSAVNADGSLRSQEDVLFETLTALQGVENQTEKARLATELFGKSGTELMPLLNSETGSIEEMKKQAHKLGLVLSDDMIDNSVELTDSLDQTKRAFSSLITNLGGSLAPVVTQMSNGLQEFLPTLQTAISELSPLLIDMFAQIGPTLVQMAQDLLPVIMNVISELLPPVTDIIMALLPTLMTILDAIVPIIEAVLPLLSPIVELLSAILVPVLDLLTPIIQVISDVLKFFLDNIIAYLTPKLENLSTFISETLVPAFKKMGEVAKDVFKKVWEVVKPIINSILGGIEKLVNGVIKGLNFILKGISKIANGVGHLIGLNPINLQLDEVTLPRLKQGGILEKGQMGFLEGDGAEAVVPLENNKKWIGAVANQFERSQFSQNNDSKLADMIGEAVAYSLQNLNIQANIELEADDRRLFKVVQQQARIYNNTTGQGAFS